MTASLSNLRESLLQMGAIAMDLHRLVPEDCEMTVARDRVAERLGLPDVPSIEEQVALHRRFRNWVDGKSGEPGPEDWALSPFVFLHGSPALGADLRFFRKVSDLMRAERQPRMLRRAIYSYLRDFREADAEVLRVANLIRESLPRHSGRWAQDWAPRAAEPRQLFTPKGLPGRLANEVCTTGEAPRSLFRDLGLSTELITHCGLHEPTALALVQTLEMGFRGRRSLGRGAVGEALGFLRAGDHGRFPDLRVAIADGLLAPFHEVSDPDEVTRGQLVEFFDQLYGDPKSKNWKDVGAPAVAVMRRWMVRKSLDLFFDVLSKTADPIWRYRRAFWLSLYRHKLIEDAWPAFGSDAQRLVRSNRGMRDRIPGFAELRQGGANQSVMVMKLPGFVIAEWSHSGSCRIWSANDARAPRFNATQYYASDLRDECLHTQRHDRTMEGEWQQELSSWIAARTGVRIPLSELIANTRA